MKFAELKSNLENKICNVYYIVGKDAYLRDSAQQMIEKRCVNNFPQFNVSYFNDENFDIEQSLNACNSIPLSDKYRVVVLNDIEPNSKDIQALQKYIKKPNETTCLIIKDGKDFSGYKSIISLCEVVDCNNLDERILRSIIVKKLNAMGVNIETDAIKMLMEYCVYDLTYIELELQKLGAYVDKGGVVTTSIINKLVHKNLEYSIFELSNAVAEKNNKKAFQLLDMMLDNKENPQNLLLLLVSNFRRIFYVATSKTSDQEIAKMLDVKEYSIKIARRLMQKFTPKKLKQILDLGGQLDFDIKNGKINDKNAIYYFVSNILLM